MKAFNMSSNMYTAAHHLHATLWVPPPTSPISPLTCLPKYRFISPNPITHHFYHSHYCPSGAKKNSNLQGHSSLTPILEYIKYDIWHSECKHSHTYKLEVHHGVEWKDLNYATMYETISALSVTWWHSLTIRWTFLQYVRSFATKIVQHSFQLQYLNV